MIGVDKQSLLPLHLQIRNILKVEIQNGDYADKIPPEFELMERFEVSRSTVRQAIANLVDDGVLEKKQGLGTFITSRPIEEWLGNFTSFIDIVNGRGLVPSIRVLNQGLAEQPKEVAQTLGMDQFFFIHRLRLADDIPLVVEKQYYPVNLGLELAKYDLNNVSTYDILESKMGQVLWDARQLITCTMPTIEEKELLNLKSASCCVLLSERFVNNQNGELIEYERSIYRADMYAFNINLSRKRSV